MKYVKKYWIPVVLLIAFIGACVYTTRDPYPVAPDGRDQWIADRQEQFLDVLTADAIDSSYLADSVFADNNIEIQLWRFEAGGQLYNDILVWIQNDAGSYKMAHGYCIAQAAVEEQDEPVSISFQSGLYNYQCQMNEDFTLTQPTRNLSVIAPLLCVLLVLIYVALTILSLCYRKNRAKKKGVSKNEGDPS